jgi:hypothetical protein
VETVASRPSDEWLQIACMAFIAALAVEILWILVSQVMLVAQAAGQNDLFLASSILLPTGATLMPAVLGVVIVWWLARRELKRTEVFPPGPAPAWMPRLAALFLALAILTFLPLSLPRNEFQTTVITFGGFFGIAALPLLTRSRLWRAIGISVLAELLFVAVVGLPFIFAVGGDFSFEWPFRRYSVFTWVVTTQLLSVFCYGVGLVALLLPGTAAAFGIGRSEATIRSGAATASAA